MAELGSLEAIMELASSGGAMFFGDNVFLRPINFDIHRDTIDASRAVPGSFGLVRQGPVKHAPHPAGHYGTVTMEVMSGEPLEPTGEVVECEVRYNTVMEPYSLDLAWDKGRGKDHD